MTDNKLYVLMASWHYDDTDGEVVGFYRSKELVDKEVELINSFYPGKHPFVKEIALSKKDYQDIFFHESVSGVKKIVTGNCTVNLGPLEKKNL